MTGLRPRAANYFQSVLSLGLGRAGHELAKAISASRRDTFPDGRHDR